MRKNTIANSPVVPPATHKRVAVAVHGAQSAHRELIRGVHRYAIEHQMPWRFPRPDVRRANFEITPERMRSLPLDGIIGLFWKPSEIAAFRRRGIACVSVLSHAGDRSTPVVASDDFEIGQTAGRHFLSQNIRRLYYYGPLSNRVGRLRMDGLSEASRAAGCPAAIALPFSENPRAGHREFSRALAEMKRDPLGPLHGSCGLLLFSDSLVDEVMQPCLDAGFRVPEQLAIAGVDDEDILCNMLRPSLTSIPQDTGRIGYLAAEQLARLFDGKKPPPQPTVIPPLAIRVRQSSDNLAVDDPIVARALRVIRDRMGENIRVADILKAMSVSRRTLEDRFSRTLGFSPYEAILRARISRAKDLLATTPQTAETVAIACGFNGLVRFAATFKRITGSTPAAWRQAKLLC